MYEIVYGIVYGFGDGSVDDAVAGGINDMDNDTAAAQCIALHCKPRRKPTLRSIASTRRSWWYQDSAAKR